MALAGGLRDWRRVVLQDELADLYKNLERGNTKD
jgi:hypothetical protein